MSRWSYQAVKFNDGIYRVCIVYDDDQIDPVPVELESRSLAGLKYKLSRMVSDIGKPIPVKTIPIRKSKSTSDDPVPVDTFIHDNLDFYDNYGD